MRESEHRGNRSVGKNKKEKYWVDLEREREKPCLPPPQMATAGLTFGGRPLPLRSPLGGGAAGASVFAFFVAGGGANGFSRFRRAGKPLPRQAAAEPWAPSDGRGCVSALDVSTVLRTEQQVPSGFLTVLPLDGRVVCSSIPTYGEGKEPGNEAGYIVGMSTCYPHPGSVKISNGETLVVVSNYSQSNQEHTGVMGLFYILVDDASPPELKPFLEAPVENSNDGDSKKIQLSQFLK
ncbi:hypothetical protein HYC85_028832 [Camellia sinensis]|uniref:Uncharacterized protein n=1 Tax=Camellia sinensis TaxID=4442 RepID=A0A7J7FXF8_CAMSI|nr:hypothetical protein HYC85_028832 [Camellia sinensis]